MNIITKNIKKGFHIEAPTEDLKLRDNADSVTMIDLTNSVISNMNTSGKFIVKYILSFVTDYGEIMGKSYFITSNNNPIEITNIQISKDIIKYKKLYKIIGPNYCFFKLNSNVTSFIDNNDVKLELLVKNLKINPADPTEIIHSRLCLTNEITFKSGDIIKYKNSTLTLPDNEDNVSYTFPVISENSDIFVVNYKNEPNFEQDESNNQTVSVIGNGGHITMFANLKSNEKVKFILSNKNIKKLSNIMLWSTTLVDNMPLTINNEIITVGFASIEIINNANMNTRTKPIIYYLIV